jgi:hypothetical protein
MKTRIVQQITVLSIILSLASCSSSVYQAEWQQKAVITDGIPAEWSLPLRFSDVKSGLQYNMTNDTSNLYLCIRATETSMQMRMIMSGIEVWIDPSGKFKHSTGIIFPITDREQRPPRIEENRTGKENRQIEMQKLYLEKSHLIQLSGFFPLYNGKFPSAESKDVLAAINQDKLGFISCEYTIPFRTFYPDKITALQKEPVFGVELVLPAARFPFERNEARDNKQRQSGNRGSEGGHLQGGGRGMGGQMGEGRGPREGGEEMGQRHHPSPDQSSESNQEAATVKFKIKLNAGTGK